MARQTREYRYDFRGHCKFPAVASGVGTEFVSKITAATGAPTIQGVNGGGLRMLFDSANEVQNLCLYMGDVLPFTISQIIRAWFIARTVDSLTAANSIAFGLATARNDTITSIADCALFRCINDNSVVIRTLDGTTTKNSIATGLTLKSTWKRFEINLAERNTTVEPPSVSLGRQSNIAFYGANDNGSSRRVAQGTRFDMTAFTTGLQLFAQFQKTASANTDNFDILECGVEVDMPNYG
jgi:hypothetical protein